MLWYVPATSTWRVQAYSIVWTRHVHNKTWPVDAHPSRNVEDPCYGTYPRRQHGRVQAYSIVWTRHVHNTPWPVDAHPSRDVGYRC